MKKYLLFFLIFLFFPRQTSAGTENRYVTVVSPVRGSNLWQSQESVKKQINLILENKIPSTWLLQYDLLTDPENLKLFENLPQDQELGIFMEVSEKLATEATVSYLFGDGDWARPDKVLLSGYKPDERKQMIDKIFKIFKEKTGYYPGSVGAWYIDTLSLDYMSEKYHIRAVLDVADQYSTDKYGLWGKPWGTPYFPSIFSSLLPAKTKKEALDLVKIQWAQRDPVKGYGLSAQDSIYSLQANDYINNGLDTGYFDKLSKLYLGIEGPAAQLTVGLEAGQEGAVFFDEFKRQIQNLSKLKQDEKVKFLTMSGFAREFKAKTDGSNPAFFLSGPDYQDPNLEAFWYSSMFYRIGFVKSNNKLTVRDFRIYPDYLYFDDLYTHDAKHNLERIIPGIIDSAVLNNAKILFSNITEFSITRKKETVEISLRENDLKDHKILLLPDKVTIDNAEIIITAPKNRLTESIKRLASRILLKYWISYPHFWQGDFRFSKIDNISYFGYMPSPDLLIGIKSAYPFIGSFQFPFQVLSRFRTFPKLNPAETVSLNLVKILNDSTIEVAGKLPI